MIEIGIFGGTFNPIHTRQLMVAQCALEQFKLDKVIFVPNGTPPHKKTDVLDKESRFEMVAAAVRDNPRFEASRIEIDRPGITYSIDTLKALKQSLGEGVRLNFIIGEDNIKSLENYARADELLSLCRLLVSPRDYVKRGMLKRWRISLPKATIEAIDCPADARSSTLIREWIRSGKSVQYLVAPAVHKILKAKKHYQQKLSPARPQDSAPSAKGRGQRARGNRPRAA
jgi:nicotinate-nucleotide adenylyltransferase